MAAYLPIAILIAVAGLWACAPWSRSDPKSTFIFDLVYRVGCALEFPKNSADEEEVRVRTVA